MTRPAAPANVAASSPGTSSWANSVVDAIVAILNDIYGATNLAIPWAKLTGVPASFTPANHTHADASHAGQIAYSVLTGIPSTFAPAVHAHAAAGSGGTIAYSVLTGVPSTFAPAVHAHAAAGSGGTIAYSVLTGVPSTFAPVTSATVQDSTAYAQAPSAGVGTTASRGDHRHGTPALPTPTQIGAAAAYDTPATVHGGRRIYVGTATPTGASEGDVWIKG